MHFNIIYKRLCDYMEVSPSQWNIDKVVKKDNGYLFDIVDRGDRYTLFVDNKLNIYNQDNDDVIVLAIEALLPNDLYMDIKPYLELLTRH